MRRLSPLVALFAAFLAYAVLRYVVFKGVAPAHVPLYVTNKAVAWLALVLVALSFALGPLARWAPDRWSGWLATRRRLGHIGLGLAALHVLLTLPIFTPAYYGKFFARPDGAGGLTLLAELSLLTGALALVLLLWLERSPPGSARGRQLGWGVLALAAAHCAFMGAPGWWPPTAWPGHLPPISLLAFLAPVAAAVVRLGAVARGR